MENVKPSTRRSITFRMTMAVCAFAILFLSLLAIVTLAYFKHEIKLTISDQQDTLLTVISQEINQKIWYAQNTLAAVSQRIPPDIVNSPDAVQRYLDNRAAIKVVFDNGLFLFSPAGRIIAESPYLDDRRGRDISFRDYYKKTISTGKPTISAPFISTHTPGAPTLMFTAPVRDKNGTLIAILGGGLNLLQDNFLGELSRTRIAKNGYIYLFANDRTLIMHPDRSRIMSKDVPHGADKMLEKALLGFDGSGENVNSSGLRSLTSVRHLQATDWILGANYPLSEAYKAVYRAEKYGVGAILVSAVLTILVIRRMMGSYTDALVRFARHVKNISSKKGGERLFQLDSRDEIGILVKVFNTMILDHDSESNELMHINSHDALTGLYNRAYFDLELKRLCSGRITPISVVMADIDDLKVCNDKYGHSVGDALITATSQILLDSFRSEDVVARIGGDEFAVLLPGVDAKHAKIAMKRVRLLAGKYESLVDGIAMSISLGCATVNDPADLPAAIKDADQQMYLDKVNRKKVGNESEPLHSVTHINYSDQGEFTKDGKNQR